MPLIVDLVSPTLLQSEPPRRLPLLLLPNLIGEYLIETPLATYINPVLIGGIVGALAMAILDVGPLLWRLLLIILTIHLGVATWRLGRCIWDDLALIKYGVLVRARILRVRSYRDACGNLAGAYLDCAIPIGQRRISVGSVWLANAHEALRLKRQERVQVICLTCPPGTWRLLEGSSTELRYEALNESRLL